MQLFSRGFTLVVLLHISICCFAAIQNNTISGNATICYGAKSNRILGTTATGGTQTIAYMWISSTTGPDSGFAPGGGLDFSSNYFPPLFTVDSWFRRVAISGAERDTSASLKITVLPFPHPVVGYTINQKVQCLNENRFEFTDTSTIASGSISSRVWDFGDLSFDTISNPVKVYPIALNYNVKLVITSDMGCKDSVIYTMSVLPKPHVVFWHDTLNQCFAGNYFLFADSSTLTFGTVVHVWDYGDGTSDSVNASRKAYAAPGIYQVKLLAVSDYNCKDSITNTVTVYPGSKAGFTVNDETQCLRGNQFVFTDTSVTDSGSLQTFWDFGNGDTSTSQVHAISYGDAMQYDVILVSVMDNGCKDSVTKTMQVYGNVAAGFTINNDSQCLDGNRFIFTDTSAAASRIWYWSNSDTSSAITDSVSYQAAGVYAVALVSSTIEGCSDSVNQFITVHPQPVTPEISGQTSVYTGHTESYSVIITSGSTYNWFADSGTIGNGNGTDSIHIIWGAPTTTASVNVVETTGFGCIGDTGSLSVVVNSIPDSLSISKDTLFVSAAASIDSFFIFCNRSWTVSNFASWITPDTLSGTNNASLHLTIAAGTTNPRLATLVIHAGLLSKELVVVQPGNTGIEESVFSHSVHLYPNPSTGVFTLSNETTEVLHLSLYNVNGKLIDEQDQLVKGDHMLDYSFLSNGIYLVQLRSGDQSRNLRLVIAR